VAASVAVAAPATVVPLVAPKATAGAADVVAPLAGMVQSVEVRVGQQVNVGDHVAVIEAMKMKTDVFTKVAGTVTSVLVKVGDSIGTDEAIISIG